MRKLGGAKPNIRWASLTTSCRSDIISWRTYRRTEIYKDIFLFRAVGHDAVWTILTVPHKIFFTCLLIFFYLLTCLGIYLFVRLFSCVSCLYIVSTAVMRWIKDVYNIVFNCNRQTWRGETRCSTQVARRRNEYKIACDEFQSSWVDSLDSIDFSGMGNE